MAVHNSAAEAVDSIDEILIQILLRLPVKSLMRFKLVSKRWNSLIISRHFSLLHNPGGHNPVLGLFYPGCRSPKLQYIHLHGNNQTMVPFAELGFPWQDNSFWIHQSCNGLFLCCSSGYLDMDNANRRSPIRSIYIYNPTTNCFTKLPRPGIVKEVPRIVVGVNLAFDHNKFPIYKVVCVRGSEFAPDLNQIEIYSAETGEWRLSGEPFSSSASFNYGVYWNGSIHWISYMSKELLFFHVDEERFEKMPLPDVRMPNIDYLHRHEVKSIGYFGECCDHLHIIKTHNTEIAFDLYEMKRDYSEWFVKYRVDLTAVSAAFPDMVSTNSFINRNFYNFSAFSLVRDEVESSFLVLKISRKGIRLDLDSNSFEEIYDFEDAVIVSSSSRRGSEYMLPCAFEYIESLAYV